MQFPGLLCGDEKYLPLRNPGRVRRALPKPRAQFLADDTQLPLSMLFTLKPSRKRIPGSSHIGSFFVSLNSFCSIRDWTHSLVHSRQALYPWAPSSAHHIGSFIKITVCLYNLLVLNNLKITWSWYFMPSTSLLYTYSMLGNCPYWNFGISFYFCFLFICFICLLFPC